MQELTEQVAKEKKKYRDKVKSMKAEYTKLDNKYNRDITYLETRYNTLKQWSEIEANVS